MRKKEIKKKKTVCFVDTCIMDTCIVDTCIVDTCIVDTCIVDTCIVDTGIMDTCKFLGWLGFPLSNATLRGSHGLSARRA